MATSESARSSALPTKAEFLENHLNVLDDCAICLEPFSTIHKPVQIRTAKCQHIFGQSCLRSWIETSQTCPLCRTQLFAYSIPNFVQGNRRHQYESGSTHVTLTHFTTRKDAETFVEILWYQLWLLCDNDEIFDSDIAEQWFVAVQSVTDHFAASYFVDCFDDEWPEILEVAQQMIRTHFANGVFRSCEPELEDIWMPMMSLALDWNFDAASEDGDHEDEDDDDYKEDSDSDYSE